MTNQKHLKSRVRARMAKTGERYAAARANVVGDRSTAGGSADDRPSARLDQPGIHPETAAMRTLVSSAGLELSEDLMLVVAGGIGAAVFAFHYPEFSSLFLTGRHKLDDGKGFVVGGLERLGLTVEVRETSGAAAARRDLVAAVTNGPAIAWCDLVELGTRGVPAWMSGGGYHLVTVLSADPEAATVTIRDLRAPETVDADRFARARARIARDRNRIAWVEASEPADLPEATRAGLRATVHGLRNPRTGSFGIAAFAALADRMVAERGRESWSTVFPTGRRLWFALRSLYEYVETYGTGGGLMRPMFARGLEEAAAITGDRRLTTLSREYAEIGRSWSELAAAALPAEVEPFAETQRLLDASAERFRAGAAPDELASVHERLAALGDEVDERFPLDDAATRELLASLSTRVRKIAAREAAALDELTPLVAG